jgi:hypothetical protein
MAHPIVTIPLAIFAAVSIGAANAAGTDKTLVSWVYPADTTL